jgi:hypothetical protein
VDRAAPPTAAPIILISAVQLTMVIPWDRRLT